MAKESKTPPRKDPRRRHLDGSSPLAALKNKDPNKHYVWVNQHDPNSFANYQMGGYGVEVYAAEGVHPLAISDVKSKIGQEVTFPGTSTIVLMSIDLDKKLDNDQYGIAGQGGRDFVEERAATLVSRTPSELNPIDSSDGRRYINFGVSQGNSQEFVR